jgi:hypothetical protein
MVSGGCNKRLLQVACGKFYGIQFNTALSGDCAIPTDQFGVTISNIIKSAFEHARQLYCRFSTRRHHHNINSPCQQFQWYIIDLQFDSSSRIQCDMFGQGQ